MPVQWPIDKISLINSALAQTGDNAVSVPNDGSDEWRVCDPAYERALAFALEDHGWVNQTKVNPALAADPIAPADTEYQTAYDIPPDCLHLIWVRMDNRPALYGILAGQIVTKNFGSPGVISIKYVSTHNSDVDNATPTFVLALQTFIISAIYTGLHENFEAGATLKKEAMAILARARTRSDMQKPRRSLFNSRLTMARRVRRPWNTSGGSWGGTGSPSS